jgi:DNA polymerase-3 subunit gamma/tau
MVSVFQLKYRPLNLTDLDLKSVALNLKKLLESSDFPQALLFSGPKGSGKTSAARIVARVLNCESKKGVDACGECSSCREILQGNSLDVVEIDAASNRGIDEARSLKDRAYLSPVRLTQKVFVIDEVHMMTRDAFNALLKLLEEPPKQTVFILCTTDEEKIPETVLSRLVKVRFEKGRTEEMVKSLHRIAFGENLKVENEVLEIIAKNSDGSFRNLHKLFNEIFIEIGNKITLENINNFFERRHGDYDPASFEVDLASGEIKKIMEKLEGLANSGIDFKIYRERMISYFQSRLLVACGVGESQPLLLPLAKIEKWLQLLISAGKIELDSFIPQLPLELMVVEFLTGVSGGNQSTILVEKPAETVISPKSEFKGPVREVRKPNENVKIDFGVSRIVDGWGALLTAVKPYNHSVEAFLRAVRPTKLDGNIVVCEVFCPFH